MFLNRRRVIFILHLLFSLFITGNIYSQDSLIILPPSAFNAVDRPEDQGGYVILSFFPSPNHPGFTNIPGYLGDTMPIDHYQVYRGLSPDFKYAVPWDKIPAVPKQAESPDTLYHIVSTRGDNFSNAYYWISAVKKCNPSQGVQTLNKFKSSQIAGYNRAIAAVNTNDPADFNSDGFIDLFDVALFSFYYGNSREYDLLFDLDKNGQVSINDLIKFAEHFYIQQRPPSSYGLNKSAEFELRSAFSYRRKSFNVDIYAKNVSSLSGYIMSVEFDQEAFEFSGIKFVSGYLNPAENSNAEFGIITFLKMPGDFSPDSCFSGSGKIASLKFKLKGEQSSPVTLKNIDIIDHNWKFNTLHDVTITEPLIYPETFRLEHNYPNPFNSVTVIEFYLHRKANVKLGIFDVKGQYIKTLAEGDLNKGGYKYKWDGTNDNGKQAGSGIYFYRLKADNFTETKKMILLR